MDISSLGITASSMNILNTIQLPEFLKTLTSPKLLSSISMEHVVWIMGGLMLFRFFSGMIFAIFGLLSFVLSTVTSVVCTFISIFVKMFGSAAIALMNLLGSTANIILTSPIKFISTLISRWGRVLIPVVASGVMSSFYVYDNPITSWFSDSYKKNWVAIEKDQAELFERF
jgi:phage-related protein